MGVLSFPMSVDAVPSIALENMLAFGTYFRLSLASDTNWPVVKCFRAVVCLYFFRRLSKLIYLRLGFVFCVQWKSPARQRRTAM